MKRIFDGTAALIALVVFAVPIMLIGFMIRLKMGSPILFRQQRPGLNGEPFTIYKFRTMHSTTTAEGDLLPDDQRRSGLGDVLRATSLDELPELFNVLAGSMSIVGPRPLLMAYLPRYSPDQARRHDVRPGITGLAQINGRNLLSWDETFELDVWYVDHMSIWLDIKIIAKTLCVVASRSGISKDGLFSREEFMGSEE